MAKIIPASIRNKNPGAMYPGQAATKFGSRSYQTLVSKDGTHRIATFPTDEQGAAAQFWLLSQPSYANGKRSIEECIKKWCGGFYVSTYLKVLESQAGVTRRSILTQKMLRDPAIAIPLARAMALQEAGRDYPLGEDGWQKAHAMAFGMAPAPVEAPSVPAPVETMPASRKDTVSKTGQGVMGFAFAFLAALKAKIEGLIDDPFGALDTASTFIAEHGWEAAAILALVGFLGFKIIRALQRQDFNEGRYQPSGAAE